MSQSGPCACHAEHPYRSYVPLQINRTFIKEASHVFCSDQFCFMVQVEPTRELPPELLKALHVAAQIVNGTELLNEMQLLLGKALPARGGDSAVECAALLLCRLRTRQSC